MESLHASRRTAAALLGTHASAPCVAWQWGLHDHLATRAVPWRGGNNQSKPVCLSLPFYMGSPGKLFCLLLGLPTLPNCSLCSGVESLLVSGGSGLSHISGASPHHIQNFDGLSAISGRLCCACYFYVFKTLEPKHLCADKAESVGSLLGRHRWLAERSLRAVSNLRCKDSFEVQGLRASSPCNPCKHAPQPIPPAWRALH